MREKLMKARKDRNMTIDQAAGQVGISKSYYWMIENGQRTPSGKVAMRISSLLKQDIKIFFS